MKTRSFFSRMLALCAVVLIAGALGLANTTLQNKPTVSEEEAKAGKAVETAPDINAKMTAAEDFLKKYPQSTFKPKLAEYIADQMLGVSDANQKLALAQKYQTLFTDTATAGLIKPVLIDAYVTLKRYDEAFAEGATHLATNGDDIQILILLTITGVEQAKSRNPKYVNASKQYGAKSIGLIEGDKKAANMDPGVWAKEKAMLPQLYQAMGIIGLVEQKPVDAQTNLEKAGKLNPADPFNYLLLGGIANEDYQKMAQNFKGMAAGKEKDDMLLKINATLDKVIDLYAHAVALSEGKPQYQQFHDQVLQDLSSYYLYRHNNSSDGMQKLIDGYKLP